LSTCLGALVGVATLLDSTDRRQVADILVGTFAEFDDASALVDGIVAALPVLSEAQRTRWIAEAIDAALAVRSVFDRAPLVAKLLPHLQIAEAGRWHQLWSEALYLVARQGREELLEAVSLLIKAPNPGHGPRVFAAMAHEMVTVFEWFP
jgi:hypothetical protein